MKADNFGLGKLLGEINRGKIQLPDFQRQWVWSDEKIKSLIESVVRGFPINSILILECDDDNIKFKPRLIAGVDDNGVNPQYLILDGQQRLTSLYGALFSDKPVKLQNDKEFFYYVDMRKAINAVENSADDEDMIISVPANRKLKSKGKIALDLSTPEKEFEAGMFPLNKIFGDMFSWILNYTSYCANDDDKKKFATKFHELIISRVTHYEVVCIYLEKNTPPAAICKIFEKVNSGVAKLGTFDLLTAILAVYKTSEGNVISLNEDNKKIQEIFAEANLSVLDDVDSSDFITALTLSVRHRKSFADKKIRVSCKGEDILELKPEEYLGHKDSVVEGFIEAAKFLEEEGITTKKFLPYKPQLIPMAAIFAELNFLNRNNAASRNKIRRWYWCGVFSEAYRDGHLARFAKDIVQVVRWIIGGKTPEVIENAEISARKIIKAKKLQSAVYKGLICLMLKNGAADFIAGKNIANYAESLEVHHIFPKKYCEMHKLPKEKFESIANKTPVLRRTNRIIGDNPPSVYIGKIEQETGLLSADFDKILQAHFADAELCRADDFKAFVFDRIKKIFDKVETLTDKKISERAEVENFFNQS